MDLDGKSKSILLYCFDATVLRDFLEVSTTRESYGYPIQICRPSSLISVTMAEEIEIPVVIVGGGGCGLTLSSFLSNYGVEHVLLEKHTGTSVLPKAHYLNQRTMEILRNHDMVEEILQKTCPPRNMSQVAWQTSLGGSGQLDRRVISKFECFGGNDGTEFAESYKYD